ncbi:MAG: response regulator [Clostridiales bacterium]|nr:response regulator [Clostridiales bacterium]
MQKTIFIVDDNATNLTMAEEALEGLYQVITLSSAARMFTALAKVLPDLILLDIEMPETNGFEAMKRLKASDAYCEIPVIFLTGMSEPSNEAYGIELGAVDFIAKPFSKPVLLNRIRNHLHLDELIRERTEQLRERTEQLRERTTQLEKLQNSIVHTMADFVESRDTNTGGHIERTTVYIKILIEALTEHGVYAEEIGAWDLDSVISSARLHDVGKIKISDSILNKPGALTEEEYQMMQTHSMEAEQIINQMALRTGEESFLHNARLSAVYHHERWDGTGYPHGLQGEDIPLQGRIMALVDVYDALTSERPYKVAYSSDEAVQIILEEAGTHFDPYIVDVFVKIKGQFASARESLDGDM